MKKELKKEKQTLNNYDLNVLLPILKKGLEKKKGIANAVTAKEIMLGLQSNGLKINMRNIARIINYIRLNDIIVGLMGASAGYYITDNEQALIKYENLLLSHEASLRNVRMSMKRQRTVLFLQKDEQPLKKVKQLF